MLPGFDGKILKFRLKWGLKLRSVNILIKQRFLFVNNTGLVMLDLA